MNARVLWLCSAFMACSVGNRTETVVIVEAQPGVAARATHTTLVITRSPDGAPLDVHSDAQSPRPARFPYVVALSPSESEDAQLYRFQVTALENGRTLAVARLISGYVQDETRYVRMLLEDACIDGPVCDPQQTCHADSCIDANVDPRSFSPERQTARYSSERGVAADPALGDAMIPGLEGSVAQSDASQPTPPISSGDAGSMQAVDDGGPAPSLLANDGKPALSLGVSHACVRLAAGGVRCWGNNEYSQLGDGSSTHSSRPVAVSGLRDVAEVRPGGDHTCARTAGGQVMCWGRSASGQAGSTLTTVRSPSVVRGLSGARGLSSGRHHSCALLASDVYCWGAADSWGLGSSAVMMFVNSTPVLVDDTSAAKDLVASSPCGLHSCLRNATSVVCWGENFYGQIGAGESSIRWPRVVPGLDASQALALGGFHTCALAHGTVTCLGDNSFGQLGDGTETSATTLLPVQGLADIQAIAAGYFHTCVLHRDGGVSCWGFGFVPGAEESTNTPTRIANLDGVRELHAGYGFTCVVKRDSSVWCWGDNDKGQLGNGTFDVTPAPTQVVGL
jgi:alpha-tubulin suppressor-like RCC1 family protein